MSKRENIFLVGPMGAGKSSIGQLLARELMLEFYDSDHVIEKRAGASIPWIFDVEGEDGYRRREKQVIKELVDLSGIVLATGGGVVAVPENRTALIANGVVIYLKTSLEHQLERTKRSSRRPLSKRDELRKQKLQEMRQQYQVFYEDLADLTYCTEKSSIKVAVRDIVNGLKNGGYF